jgi:hypothetical protein
MTSQAVAFQAGQGAQVAVHLQDVLGTGADVQAVNVLGDERLDDAAPLQLGQGQVGRVGLGLAHRPGPRPNPIVEDLGAALKALQRGGLKGVNGLPQSGAWGAEVRYARGRGDARPGEGHGVAGFLQKLRCLRDLGRKHPISLKTRDCRLGERQSAKSAICNRQSAISRYYTTGSARRQ